MAEIMITNVTCPQCGKVDEVEIWATVNASSDPNAVQWIIDGFLFEWECTGCGCAITLNHDCLYHDPDRKVMIQYVSKPEKILDAARALEALRSRGYELRIVTSLSSLREKVAIERDGLDDKVVELLKFALFNKFVAEGKLQGTDVAYYGAIDEDGGIIVEFIGQGDAQESSIPRELYDSVAQQVPHLDRELLGSLSVDRAWAAKANEQLG